MVHTYKNVAHASICVLTRSTQYPKAIQAYTLTISRHDGVDGVEVEVEGWGGYSDMHIHIHSYCAMYERMTRIR